MGKHNGYFVASATGNKPAINPPTAAQASPPTPQIRPFPGWAGPSDEETPPARRPRHETVREIL